MNFTLPGRYYTDPDVFRRELDVFYLDSWICAGRAEWIPEPGDFFLCEVAGESIIVTRDLQGEVRAHYNVCRHRGTRLCTEREGRFRGRILCPYHGWTYGLDGALIGAPHMDEAGFRSDDYPLHSASVAVWDGHAFVHLGSDPPLLADQLGTLPEKFAAWHMQDLQLVRRIVYDVKANWKLVVLNYNECLHCPLLHPALNRLTDYLGADNEAPAAGYVGGAMRLRDGAETMSTDGKRRRAYLPGLDEHQRGRVEYYAIFPNMLLSLHPDYMMLHRLWPREVHRTEVVCEWYFHPNEIGKPDFVPDDAIEFWDVTNREDWAISEQSQAGIQSRRYSPGPYTGRETLLHAFDEYILSRL
jgi:Rieske 2Fe-2S family protein